MQQNKQLEKLSAYFQKEMRYLLEGGARFAAQYPKIAQRLDWHRSGSDDPHVSRLLESFAFLTAQLHLKIDDQFTDFTSALLAVLYPQFVNPIPSAAIMHFSPLSEMAASLSGTTIPRRTPLFTTSQDGQTCRFQTTQDVTLWPVDVCEVSCVNAQACDLPLEMLRSSWVLKIRLRATTGDFSQMPFQSLVFHLAGDFLTAHTLYEWLLTYDPYLPTPVFIQPESGKPLLLNQGALKPIGFDPEDALTPVAAQTHHAYQLLLEYFAFPQKFLFFKIDHIPTEKKGKFFDFLIPLGERSNRKKLFLKAEHIQTGCTPAVNLFFKTAEPIRLDHRTLEYRLIGDHAREKSTEIHSILKISATVNPEADTHVYAPYFSFKHQTDKTKNPCFWLARRVPHPRENFPGTDVLLSFVDYHLNLSAAPAETIYAHTLCTNRQLASQIPAGASLEIQGGLTGLAVKTLERPTSQILPPLSGDIQWRFISHLALNHLGLCAQDGGIEPLQELLRLYNFIDNTPRQSDADALVSVSFHQTVGRVHQEAWRGFVPQLSIHLTVDESQPNTHGLFLLGIILDQLFRLSAGFNTLIETTIFSYEKQNIWKKWPPNLATDRIL